MRLRQFHAEGSKRVQESVIGVYDWVFGEKVEPAGVGTAAAIVQKYGKGTPCDVRNGLPREASVRFECMPPGATLLPGAAGIVGGGDAAGGAAFSAVAHAVALLGIQESPTCVYTVRIGTSLACDHPDVSPAKASATQAPPVEIACVPVWWGSEGFVRMMSDGGKKTLRLHKEIPNQNKTKLSRIKTKTTQNSSNQNIKIFVCLFYAAMGAAPANT
jgi:hypothetical protein